MHSLKCVSQAGGLVLLALLLNLSCAFAQVPKPFLKYAEKHNKVRSGYVKLQRFNININNDTTIIIQDAFFISTSKDLKYLAYSQTPSQSNIFCKSAYTILSIYTWRDSDAITRGLSKIESAKDRDDFLYPIPNGIPLDDWDKHVFQRIPPKMAKKNIRYKIIYPDQEILSDISVEHEFDKKELNLIQHELSVMYAGTFHMYYKIDILEQHLYDYIHPDILDTISFKFEEIREEYDRKIAERKAEQDSLLRDSISRSESAGKWTGNLPQDIQKDTTFFMPEWKFPTLSGDTLYSDSINTQLLLIDMWYIACPPCMNVMHDLPSLDTVYNKSLFKVASINVLDKDTAQIRKVVRNFNLPYDVACAYSRDHTFEMTKEMGDCLGYPQLYLIDMKTKQVIWHTCGWYQGFTKDIEDIIKTYEEE